VDKNGNLTEVEKAELAKFLEKLRSWWLDQLTPTRDLIDSFENLRKLLEKE
jgi:L-alanine-DL-glutamate epimerase-like enolase superfamily enzyme